MDVANDEHLKRPKLIDPPKEDEVLVTCQDTLDGFLAAWVVRKIAREKNIAVEMAPADIGGDGASEGRNHIAICADGFPAGTKGKSLLIFTTSNPEGATAPIAFEDWKRTFPYGIEAMTRGKMGLVSGTSLCKATWEFFHADANVAKAKLPRLLDYVNDSMTDNRYGDTAEILACLESYHRNFQVFDRLIEACDDHKRRAYMVAAGQAILRYKELNPPA